MHSNGPLPLDAPLDARCVYTLSLSIHFLKMMRYKNMDEKILCSFADLRNARRHLMLALHLTKYFLIYTPIHFLFFRILQEHTF